MVIYRGSKYNISTDGMTAIKSGGDSSRTMRYYPERDISAIAGEIDELTAWQILRDIARQSASSTTPISPEHILIDGSRFILSEWSESVDSRFTAPEGYSSVWALGATVFFTFMGCHVFQGLGGKGQTATAPVPTLRRELTELSTLIVSCLDYNPDKRPLLAKVIDMAEENIKRCERLRNELPPLKKRDSNQLTSDEIDSYWREEMY